MRPSEYQSPLAPPSRRWLALLALGAGLAAALVYGLLRAGLDRLFSDDVVQSVVAQGVVGVGAAALVWVALKLREEARKLRFTQFALDQVGDPIFWVKPNGRFFYVNDAACQYLGFSREQLLKLSVPDIDPTFSPAVWEQHWEDLTARRTIKLETVHRGQHGQEIPVEITARYMVYAGQPFNGAVVRDIRARRQAEQALRETEERNRLLLESTGEGIIGVDLEGRSTFINPAALSLLGYPDPASIVGEEIHPLIHHSAADGTPHPREQCQGLRAVQSGAVAFVEDEVYWRADGTCIEVEYRVHPLRRDGELIGAVYSFQDISARRKAERDLRRFAQQLQEANQLKDLFTDILSHDLKNPASAIGLSVVVLQRLETDPKKARMIENLRESSQQLIDICESASRYAKVTSVEQLELTEQDLVPMLQEIARGFGPLFDEKRMRLRFEPNGPCLAKVNPILGDAFANLISNAIKYGPQDSEVTLALCSDEAGVLVEVLDQGDGIPDEDKPRLFNRFERLGREGVKGTGLGLAIAKRAVELHGGRIWADDRPGGGTVFRIRLPRDPPQP
jgi:PAS domain S-box-containing protein